MANGHFLCKKFLGEKTWYKILLQTRQDPDPDALKIRSVPVLKLTRSANLILQLYSVLTEMLSKRFPGIVNCYFFTQNSGLVPPPFFIICRLHPFIPRNLSGCP
jgi:hypothetical protein